MPVIKIWDSVGLGVIIDYPTGIHISNQTGGTTCLQPYAEGIYLPLANDYSKDGLQFLSPEIELSKYFEGEKHKGTGATNGIDIEDAEFITDVLSKFGLQDFIKVDMEKLMKSHEAWIYVNIYSDNSGTGLLSNFDSELKGILTWSNSN